MRQRAAYCLISFLSRGAGEDGDRMTPTSAPGETTPRTDRGAVAPALEARIRAATLTCVTRWGISKTTLDNIAREAGCSRATIYRTFPGGKDTVMMATFAAETAAYFAELADAIDATDTLEDLLTVALSWSCAVISGDECLQYLLEHEPESILPWVSFDGLDPLLDWARGFAVPHLQRFVDEDTARDLGEWMARLVISYGFEHEPDTGPDLTDATVARRFVRTYVLPGVDGDRVALDLTASPSTLDPTPSVPTTRS